MRIDFQSDIGTLSALVHRAKNHHIRQQQYQRIHCQAPLLASASTLMLVINLPFLNVTIKFPSWHYLK